MYLATGPHDEVLPGEDLGVINVGRLSGSGAFYALPLSFYDYDAQLQRQGQGPGQHCDSPADCIRQALPPTTWKETRHHRCFTHRTVHQTAFSNLKCSLGYEYTYVLATS